MTETAAKILAVLEASGTGTVADAVIEYLNRPDCSNLSRLRIGAECERIRREGRREGGEQ